MNIIKIVQLAVCFIVWIAVFADLSAGTFYVSPTGDDSNSGTRDAPWRSAGHAGRQATAGDTVLFLPGDYEDALIPAKSGTPEAPIVFAATERRKARLIGAGEGALLRGEGGRIFLKDVAYIVIRGFEILDTARDSSSGGWLVANNASHLTVEDCRFFGGHRWYPLNVQNSEQVRILDSEFSRSPESDEMHGMGDIWRIRDVRHLLVEGNSFSKSLHTMAGISSSEDVVVRGNVFHAGWSRNFSTLGVERALVENNIFTNGYNGSRSAGAMNQHRGNQIIHRYNQIFRNFGIPIVMTTRPPDEHTVHNRFYNNVFQGNSGWGIVVESHRGNLRDMVFKNNIFADNDPYATRTQLLLSGGGAESVAFRRNNFYSGKPDNPALLQYATNPVSLKEAQREDWPGKDDGALPGWMLETERIVGEWLAAENRDPLRRTPEPMPLVLSQTGEAGSGTRMPVLRSRSFVAPQEGFLDGEDVVFAGASGNTARLLGVDLKTDELILDQELTWDRRVPVGRVPSTGDAAIFRDNLETDPQFEAPHDFNFALKAESPLRERGLPLTRTREAGGGRELPVEDVQYFYDGFGIEGEAGDRIAIGEPSKQAMIEDIDYERNILVLDRSLRWNLGDPVGLPWNGKAPSLGLYEDGPAARPSVQVTAENAVVRHGETVTLSAIVRGLEAPVRYDWQLGDGSRAEGKTVKHRFAETDDFGIRVRVTDDEGKSWVGVGYVMVEEERDPNVMIHTTFDADDEDWWIHWQFYRGRIHSGYASYERVLDEETGRGYHRTSPRDGNRPIPAFLHPRYWNIDHHPNVRIRYRISPGSPVAIFVRPFPSAYHAKVFFRGEQDFRQDARRYYFAGTDAEPRGEQRLIDDGEWHEITFDVRDVRKKFPEVDVLQSLEIGDLDIDGGAKVGPNDEFSLDEIYIGR